MTERQAWAYGLIVLIIIVALCLEWRRRTIRNRGGYHRYKVRSGR